ncbi:hypothetical protein D3C71_1817940 [compost metagenome]
MTAEYEIKALCHGTSLPLNVLGVPGLPSPEALEALGVRRLSAGSGIAEFLYGAMAGIAQSFLQTGKFDSHNLKAFTYGEINALLKPSGKA